MKAIKLKEVLFNSNDSHFVNLKENELLVLYCHTNTELADEELETFMNLLPDFLQNEVLRYRKWEDSYNALFGKLLVKIGFEFLKREEFNFSLFKKSETGKPYLEGERIKFNISHCHGFAICVFGYQEIGIDVEKNAPINYNNFTMAFNPKEIDIMKKEGVDKFYEFWTKKESILKATGEGIATSLKKIDSSQDQIVYGRKTFRISKHFFDDKFCSIAYTSPSEKDIKLLEVTYTE